MENRYTQLFKLPERIFSESSPVVIVAGALLKDNQSGEVLAQLKFKNISTKHIKAIKVAIDAFAVSGEMIQGVREYQYLDLDECRDAEFGQKIAIYLPENTTRSFVPSIIAVIFQDNSTWLPQSDAIWEPIKKQQTLEEYFKDHELVKQYEIETKANCKYRLLETKGLWLCTCGAVNQTNETSCHICEAEISVLRDELHDISLEKRRDIRLEIEAQESEARAEQEENTRQKRKLKQKRIVAFLIPTIAAISLALLFAVVIPNRKTEKAVQGIEAGINSYLVNYFKNEIFASVQVDNVSVQFESEKVIGDTLTLTGVAICTFTDIDQKAYIPFSSTGTIGSTSFETTFEEGYIE